MNTCKVCFSPTETRILFTGEYEHCVNCESPKKPDKSYAAAIPGTFNEQWITDNKTVPVFAPPGLGWPSTISNTPGKIVTTCEHKLVLPYRPFLIVCGDCKVELVFDPQVSAYVEKK